MSRRKLDKLEGEALWRRGVESRVIEGVISLISAVQMEQCALRCSLLLFNAIFWLLRVIFDKVSDYWQPIKASTLLINQ